MTDLATLGLAIDPSQVKSATSALQDFRKAANDAEGAAQDVGKAANDSSAAFAKVKGPTGDFARSFTTLDQASGNYSKTTNTVINGLANQYAQLTMNGRALAQYNAVNKLGADTNQDVVKQVSNAAGALYDMEQQQKQLTAANDNSTNSLERFANTITRRVIGLFVISGIKDFIGYVWNLNTALAATAATAQNVGANGQLFQGLQAGASNKGISNTDFNSGIVAFNQQLALAKAGAGDLKTLLSSNGQAVGDTATTLGRVADLVQRASGDYAKQTSILQQANLPATQQWVEFMQQGSVAINKIADSSAKLSNQQLDEAKKLNDQFNELWTNFETWGKRAIVNVSDAIKAGINAKQVQAGLGELDPNVYGGGAQLPGASSANPLASPRGIVTRGADLPAPKPTGPVFDPALAKQQLSLEQQRLGLLGPLATVEDQVRAKQLEINAASLNNVNISKSQRDALLLVTQAQAEQSRVQSQAQIGVFNLAAAQKASNDNLRALVAEKLLDPNNAQQWAAAMQNAAKNVEQLANNAKVAGAPLEQLQRLSNDAGSVRTQLDQLSTTTLNSLSDDLVSIASGSVSASDGIKNFANSFVQALEKMIIQIMVIKPLADALQQSLSGLGILGGGSTASVGATYATGSSGSMGGVSFPIFGAANGGTFGPGWGVVGERGPELINVHSAGVTVIPNHISRPYLPGFADGGMLSSSGNVTRGSWGRQDNSPKVIINNQTNTPIQQSGVSQNSNGDFEVTLTNMVTGVLTSDAAKNGPISKAFAARQAGFSGS